MLISLFSSFDKLLFFIFIFGKNALFLEYLLPSFFLFKKTEFSSILDASIIFKSIKRSVSNPSILLSN